MIFATGMIVFSCAEIGSPYRVLTLAWLVTLSLSDCKRARLPMGNSFWATDYVTGSPHIQFGNIPCFSRSLTPAALLAKILILCLLPHLARMCHNHRWKPSCGCNS